MVADPSPAQTTVGGSRPNRSAMSAKRVPKGPPSTPADVVPLNA